MADKAIANLNAASALTGNELFVADDFVDPIGVKVTATQIKTFCTTGSETQSISYGNSVANLIANSTIVKVANSTGIANLQSGLLAIGTSVINTTALAEGANVILSTVDLKIGNSTANLFANSILVKVANATHIANLQPSQLVIGTSVVNSTVIAEGANLVIDTVKVSIGNSTANMTVNSVSMVVANSTGTTTINPTSFATSFSGANGYSRLPNGLVVQWGWVAANTDTGDVTFPLQFPTAIFSAQATSNSTVAANAGVAVFALTTTGMSVRSTSTAAASNTYWFAIGN